MDHAEPQVEPACVAFEAIARVATTAVFDLTPKPDRVDWSRAKSWSMPSRRNGEDLGGLAEHTLALPGR